MEIIKKKRTLDSGKFVDFIQKFGPLVSFLGKLFLPFSVSFMNLQ